MAVSKVSTTNTDLSHCRDWREFDQTRRMLRGSITLPNLDPSYYYKFVTGDGWEPYDDEDEHERRRRERYLGG